MTFSERIKEILGVFWELIWRGFGLFLFIFGSSAGVGAIATGSPLIGITVAWGTLMLGVISALGYAIAITGKATRSTVAKGVRDAVQKFEEQEK